MNRLRVILSAYACEPHKSSEQGVGWNWALALSDYCDVSVITRANNRSAIEAECLVNPTARRISWHYHDLDRFWLLVKRKFRCHRLYYSLWQRSFAKQLPSFFTSSQFDLAHHLTFASFRYPTAVSEMSCRSIWGPVGGAETTPWRLLPKDHLPTVIHEVIRNFQMFSRHPLAHAKSFSRILTSTPETRSFLEKNGLSTVLMPTIGIAEDAISHSISKVSPSDELRLLFVGNLHHLKGIHFAIEALAQVPSSIRLTIVGRGPYETALKRSSARLSVPSRVDFRGFVENKNLPKLHHEHDIFVFPSLHDSGGMALLEAMASGMPSIVLASGGPQIITDVSCAEQIPLGSHGEIVTRLAAAIQRYAADPSRILKHGLAARERVIQHFLWRNKAKKMVEIYHEVCQAEGSSV